MSAAPVRRLVHVRTGHAQVMRHGRPRLLYSTACHRYARYEHTTPDLEAATCRLCVRSEEERIREYAEAHRRRQEARGPAAIEDWYRRGYVMWSDPTTQSTHLTKVTP